MTRIASVATAAVVFETEVGRAAALDLLLRWSGRALDPSIVAVVTTASDDILDALAAANREYQDRFGYIFIVCASGKSAGEMLAILRERLSNDPAVEIGVAAEEGDVHFGNGSANHASDDELHGFVQEDHEKIEGDVQGDPGRTGLRGDHRDRQ